MPILLWSTLVTQSTTPPRARRSLSSAGAGISVVAMVSRLRALGPAADGRAATTGGPEALELVLRHHPDPEQHVRVGQTAELRALPVVQAHALEAHVELVGRAGDRLALEQGPRDVEGMHDVGRPQLDVDRHAHGNDHLRDVPGPPDDLLVRVLVVELPAQLEPGDVDGDLGRRVLEDDVLGAE